MRNDRRTPLELQELIERKVKIKLSSWEKRNIKEQYREKFNSKFQENCGSCWTNAIKELSRLDNGKKNKPALVKEKMIVHEKPNAEITLVDLEEKTLKELRVLYPNIKATSKKVFIEKVNEENK